MPFINKIVFFHFLHCIVYYVPLFFSIWLARKIIYFLIIFITSFFFRSIIMVKFLFTCFLKFLSMFIFFLYLVYHRVKFSSLFFGQRFAFVKIYTFPTIWTNSSPSSSFPLFVTYISPLSFFLLFLLFLLFLFIYEG